MSKAKKEFDQYISDLLSSSGFTKDEIKKELKFLKQNRINTMQTYKKLAKIGENDPLFGTLVRNGISAGCIVCILNDLKDKYKTNNIDNVVENTEAMKKL